MIRWKNLTKATKVTQNRICVIQENVYDQFNYTRTETVTIIKQNEFENIYTLLSTKHGMELDLLGQNVLINQNVLMNQVVQVSYLSSFTNMFFKLILNGQIYIFQNTLQLKQRTCKTKLYINVLNQKYEMIDVCL